MENVRAGKGPPPKRPKVRDPKQPATEPPTHLLRPQFPAATPLPMPMGPMGLGPTPRRPVEQLGNLRPPNPMEAFSQGMAVIAEGLSSGMQHISGVLQQMQQANRAGHAREMQLVYALGRAQLDLPDFHAETDPYGAPADPLPPPSQQPSSEPSAPPLVLVHEDVAFGVEIGELQHAQDPESEVEVVEPPQTEPPLQEEPRRSRFREKTPDPNWNKDQKEDQ